MTDPSTGSTFDAKMLMSFFGYEEIAEEEAVETCITPSIEFVTDGFEDTYLVVLSAILDENEDELQIQWPKT